MLASHGTLNTTSLNSTNLTIDSISYLNSDIFYESDDLFTNYIRPGWKLINELVYINAIVDIKSELNFLLIMFVILTIYLVLIILAFDLPFQHELGEDIKRTQKLIEIIPIEVKERYMAIYNKDE